MDKTSHVYILTDRRNGTLYTGVTTDIIQRISQHRDGVFPGFTQDYGLKTLVWLKRWRTSKPPSPAKNRSNAGGANGNWH